MIRRAFVMVAATLAVSSVAGAQKFIGSPAQDLFDQATFFLDTQYFGPSNKNIAELVAAYQLKLDEACTAQGVQCGFDKAEPLIAQMLDDLQDQHAYYLSAEAVQAEQANRAGQNTSPSPRVGIQHRGFCATPSGECTFDDAGNLKDKLQTDRLIVNVLPNSPAEKAGLRYGDRWIGYNGTLFATFPDGQAPAYTKFLEDFSVKIRASETITMNILRGPNRQRLDIPLKGEIVNLSETPTLELRPDGIAVLKVRDYQIRGMGQRVHDLVKQAVAGGAKGIIFNERGNGGGSVAEMLFTVAAFVPTVESFRFVPRYNADRNTVEYGYQPGKVFIRNPAGVELGSSPLANPTVTNLPMTVLVDSGCASGCEYFAAYMQRAKRAPVIGEPTVGIGNTNTARFNLINGGAAGMPTVRAFWPDGISLPAQITPDMPIQGSDYTLFNTGRDPGFEKALELLGVKSTLAVNTNEFTSSRAATPTRAVPLRGLESHRLGLNASL
jgi:carboxyl-terminal processing protease